MSPNFTVLFTWRRWWINVHASATLWIHSYDRTNRKCKIKKLRWKPTFNSQYRKLGLPSIHISKVIMDGCWLLIYIFLSTFYHWSILCLSPSLSLSLSLSLTHTHTQHISNQFRCIESYPILYNGSNVIGNSSKLVQHCWSSWESPWWKWELIILSFLRCSRGLKQLSVPHGLVNQQELLSINRETIFDLGFQIHYLENRFHCSTNSLITWMTMLFYSVAQILGT